MGRTGRRKDQMWPTGSKMHWSGLAHSVTRCQFLLRDRTYHPVFIQSVVDLSKVRICWDLKRSLFGCLCVSCFTSFKMILRCRISKDQISAQADMSCPAIQIPSLNNNEQTGLFLLNHMALMEHQSLGVLQHLSCPGTPGRKLNQRFVSKNLNCNLCLKRGHSNLKCVKGIPSDQEPGSL